MCSDKAWPTVLKRSHKWTKWTAGVTRACFWWFYEPEDVCYLFWELLWIKKSKKGQRQQQWFELILNCDLHADLDTILDKSLFSPLFVSSLFPDSEFRIFDLGCVYRFRRAKSSCRSEACVSVQKGLFVCFYRDLNRAKINLVRWVDWDESQSYAKMNKMCHSKRLYCEQKRFRKLDGDGAQMLRTLSGAATPGRWEFR